MKKNIRTIVGLALLALWAVSCAPAEQEHTFGPAPQQGFVSWLPANKWEDALLTGNGAIGGMVMGYPYEETIILNHALLYLPNQKPVAPPNMAAHLADIRKLFFAGKWGEAAHAGFDLWKKEHGQKNWTDPYVPAANLKIDMPGENVQAYRRMVDYTTAEAIVQWTDTKGSYTRSTFASRADDAMVTRITGSLPVTATVGVKQHPYAWEQWSFMKEVIAKSEAKTLEGGILHYHCEYAKAHQNSPKGYEVLVRVVNQGGKLSKAGQGACKVEGANEVLVYTVIEPVYDYENFALEGLLHRLTGLDTDYEALLQRQKDTHGQMFGRVQLDLNTTSEEKNMTSETLVLKARQKTSPGIIQRQFEAARYHILCATGINPPNLQGIWSGTWTPPWSSDFTHDGNVEVAISNLLNGNMQELMMAYFDYHERLMPHYRTNAKQLYGARGIHVPSHTSTHGYNNHYDQTWCMEYWNGGAGWTAQYFYDYYLYTQDLGFLKKRAFPFMNEALEFWEDVLVMGDDGKYVVVPSYSPENNPLEHQWQNCINATMDVMIIKELTRNWIEAAKLLDMDKADIAKKQHLLANMPDYQISNDGVIREWLWPGFTDNQAHRHASHLYGLYEVPDPEILASEDLKKAAAKTINERMKIRKQQSGGEMAFGMCHLAFAAINIGDTQTGAEILNWLSKYYWTNGMATTHNPGNLFNMDISGGFPAIVTRMLVNSRPGHLAILPALPTDWKQGSVTGIKARGAITVNKLAWGADGVELSLTSNADQTIELSLGAAHSGAPTVSGKGTATANADGSFKVTLQAREAVTLVFK